MEILLIVCCVLTACYVALMLLYRAGWTKQKDFIIPPGFKPSVFISVIIPARNEEGNIVACINSILAQQYPEDLFEIIVIDDHSTDNTAAIVQGYNRANVTCLSLADHLSEQEQLVAYKKRALTIGISKAKGELIVTTDADCIAGDRWLCNLGIKYETDHCAMIVAPVDFIADKSTVQVFQSLDFMSMQGITAAAQALNLGNMSNGANLAFSKPAFYEVGGYMGIDHLASGDDFLLMMKLQKKYPSGIGYLKSHDAIVRTTPQPDWENFLQQRIRWASKSGKYDDNRLTAILLLVYLYNLSFLVLLIAGLCHLPLLIAFVALLAIKTAIELFFITPVAAFFSKQKQLARFPLLQPLHIAYIILAGFLGFVGVYQWKGRSVR